MIIIKENIPDTPMAQHAIARILTDVPLNDIYSELAEEASELAQAALKMCRIGSATNPTDKTYEQARQDLVEEYTDVLNIAMRVLDIQPDWLIGDYKLYRWCKRLEEAKIRDRNKPYSEERVKAE